MPPNTKRKRGAEPHLPEKKAKIEATPPPPPPRARPVIPGTITMGMLNRLGSIPKRRATSAPSASTPSRTSTSPNKKRKRSDSAATEDGSIKKSRQESSLENEAESEPIKKEASVPVKKAATKSSAPRKKSTTSSEPASSSRPPGVICPVCSVEQASINNMARHQRGKTCQERAYQQNHEFSKSSPQVPKKPEPKALRASSSPASKKSAAGSKTSRSRGDSTSTKRTSLSSTLEELSSKAKAPRTTTPRTTTLRTTTLRTTTLRTTTPPPHTIPQAEEPTPTTVPSGLLNMRGVSVQNAALQLLFSTFSDEEIEVLCNGDEPKMFNLKDEELLKLDSAGRPKKRSRFDVKLAEAKEKIVKIVLCPPETTDEEFHNPDHTNEPAIKLGPYIGQLFKKMRAAEKSGSKMEITAMMVQTVFALSGKKFLNTMDEAGTDLETALAGRKILDVFEQDSNESAGEYLTNLINAFGREHPFVLEKFSSKVQNFGHCDQEERDGKHQKLTQDVVLNATVPAEHYDPIIGNDDDEYKCEIQHSTNYVIQKALGYDEVSDLPCPENSCDGTMDVKPCIIQYSEFLLVPTDHEDAEAPLHTVNLMSFKVGEQKYRMTGMVQQDDRTGHNVAYREVEGRWWKLSDEDVESTMPAGLQDSCRRKCCVVLLRKL